MMGQEHRPGMTLLPDMTAEVVRAEEWGLVETMPLKAVAEAMEADGGAAGPDILGSLRTAARNAASPEGEAVWRGAVALALLWDTWAETPAALAVREIEGDTPLSAMVLAARRPCDREKRLRLVTLGGRLLGVAHPALGLIPRVEDLTGLLPPRVCWYRADGFADPTPCLNERDRAVLIRRLSLLSGEAARRFAAALLQEGLRTSRALAAKDEAALRSLALRAMAVCGMADNGFPELTAREEEYAAASENPLLKALDAAPSAQREDARPQRVYCWRGVPFARASTATAIEPAGVPGEAEALAELAGEIELLSMSSQWQRETAKRLNVLIKAAESRALSPAAREALTETKRACAAAGQGRQAPLKLTWPWRPDGAAVWLLRSSLGSAWADMKESPFSDRLTLLPDATPDALGDAVLNLSCRLPEEQAGMRCMAVPPLSPACAARVAQEPECLPPQGFSFAVTAEDGVRAEMTIRGKDEVVISRVYDEGELTLLQPEETPTIAVWPSVRFPTEDWRAYFVYIHGLGPGVRALNGGRWEQAEEHLWSVMLTDTFPTVLTLHREGQCLGTLLNLLPVFRAERTAAAVAAMDLGLSGVAAALCLGDECTPLKLPNLVRTLMHGSRPAPFEEEFLPPEPISGILPAVVSMTREAEAPAPLLDGHIGPGDQPDKTFAALKWGLDPASRKARRLLLRQTMLTAALDARMRGAARISWRIALPGQLAASAREALMADVRDAAPTVSAEACLPLDTPAVLGMEEGAALTAYMRRRVFQRGGFIALDVGAEQASLTLWLRGMSRPCGVVRLPLGIHAMVLEDWARQPEGLRKDFAGLVSCLARSKAEALAGAVSASSRTLRGMERCRLLADECLGGQLPALAEEMNRRLAQGETAFTQALLLMGFAVLMTSTGLMLEQAKRDAAVNDYLPGNLPLYVTGRGGQMLASLPDTLKIRLLRFARLGMSAEHPVRQLNLSFSQEPKMEIALGLARAEEGLAETADAVPSWPESAVPMSPLMLLRRLVLAFYEEFPLAARRLLPGLVEDGRLTDAAEERLQSAIQQCPGRTPTALAASLVCVRGGLPPMETDPEKNRI